MGIMVYSLMGNAGFCPSAVSEQRVITPMRHADLCIVHATVTAEIRRQHDSSPTVRLKDRREPQDRRLGLRVTCAVVFVH